MTTKHELAAIMFADIAGFTAMMGEDEAFAMKQRERLKKKLEREVALHSGAIIKFSGDGVLCSFHSAIEAVRAAIAVQLEMRTEPKVPLRIGIHQADVAFEEGDVHGDGVNIASRLESIAVTGSILVSSRVYDDCKNQKDIQTASLGKYNLKNVKEPIEIFAIANAGLNVPLHTALEGKAVKYKEHKTFRQKVRKTVPIALPLTVLTALALVFVPTWIKKQEAKSELLPAIQKLVNDNFRPPTEALDLALEAQKYIPDNPELKKLIPLVSVDVSMQTEPQGAEVFWRDYNQPNAQWRSAGITPFKDLKFPRGYLKIEIRKPGYQSIEYAGPWSYGSLNEDLGATIKLDKVETLPENMVRIPAKQAMMAIVGLEQHGGKAVNEFLIDRYEVTNKQYKAFMDAGGYTNKAYWKYPISVATFVDRTGRPGPATFEAGTFPNGEENFPVTGVSWYEAAAYANYAGKALPTAFHWSRVADTSRTEFIVPMSNFNGKATTAVGSLPDFSSWGIYDLAGNAREWCFNESATPGQRFILGGGYNDPTYAFNDAYTQSDMDRSTTNGFRCIKEIGASQEELFKPLTLAFRDYRKEKAVDDKTFAIFLRQYEYDKSPLNAKIEATINGEFWTAQKITFDAGYNNERMQTYLYVPKDFKPPYQTILFFPGSGDIFSKKYDPESITGRIDFLLKSGRAIVRPIYKGTHERHDDLNTDIQENTVFYRDHVIMWRKDIGRSLDYLATRDDIQMDKIGFLGWSWGGFMGGIYPAIEKRIKAVVLNVGGMEMHKALPEADQVNFLPRVTQPVLMLNGKHDMYFPVETAQNPMFDLLGSPKADKKKIVYDSGHLVPRTEFVKESLLWYDKYLGPIPLSQRGTKK